MEIIKFPCSLLRSDIPRAFMDQAASRGAVQMVVDGKYALVQMDAGAWHPARIDNNVIGHSEYTRLSFPRWRPLMDYAEEFASNKPSFDFYGNT